MLQRHPARTIHRAMPTARSHKRWAARATLVSAIGVLVFQIIPAQAAQPRVGLGTAAAYGVLAGQGVTNTGPSVINGNVGTSPNGSVTGFPPGLAHGAIHRADAAALQAQSDLTTAYNDAAGRTPVTTIATELGGRRLTPGVYDSASGTFHITGTLTLDAQGDPDGVFIFKTASTLITASSSNVSLLGRAQSCNTFWKVGSSATLGTTSSFRGNILALTSVQVQTRVNVLGRVMARNASVTLDNDVITAAACVAGAGTGSGGGSSGGGSGTGGGTGTGGGSSQQVGRVPHGGVQTGGGSTAGFHRAGFLIIGGLMLAGAVGAFAVRRHALTPDDAPRTGVGS